MTKAKKRKVKTPNLIEKQQVTEEPAPLTLLANNLSDEISINNKPEKDDSTIEDFQPDDIFADFFVDTGSSPTHQILNDMISPKGVEPKTEIDNPMAVAQLRAIADALRAAGMEICAKIIESFIQYFLTYMISYKRKSRAEVFAALTEQLKVERTMGEKLTKPSE